MVLSLVNSQMMVLLDVLVHMCLVAYGCDNVSRLIGSSRKCGSNDTLKPIT